MGKGFYISKAVLFTGVVLAAAAAVTIIALAVVYAQEKANNSEAQQPDRPGTGTEPPAPGTEPPAPGTEPPAPGTETPAPGTEPWDRYRLPGDLIPDHYEVTLWPRLDEDPVKGYYFTGNSTVYFRCEQATKLILVHSHKLKVINPELRAIGAGSPPVPTLHRWWLHNKTQFLVIELSNPLSKGNHYSLHTQFEGALADDLRGFYRSNYVNETGHVRVIATTQMQPTDARKAFPCFDEPAMKATFNITLYHKEEHSAISNMPEYERTTIHDNDMTWIITSFEKTPKMSTYLLAFIVSDFDYDYDNTSDTEIRIWARKQAIEEDQGKYAVNVTGKILQFFENYYNVFYPLPKSDQIALPDFNAGAMENWGLITYRETALLYDRDLSSIGNKERVVTVIAHELAHQWFGNLVTIKWWNDLWLNEGFASYVEYLGADEAEPEWGVKDLIVLDEIYRVFAVDALASSHPLSSEETDINTPAQINELFDAISYSKGASVLRMLSDFLTEEIFVRGLNTYLRQFSYGNTIYTDLFEHLQKAVDSSINLPTTVGKIMSRWTLQMGFPVITIDTTTGTVTQKHFLLDPNSTVTRPSKFNYTWIVPITWMKGGIENSTWLLDSQKTILEMKLDGKEWLVANINVTGYYRVNYDETNWKKLVNLLLTNHEHLPVINRAQIMADSFNLARAKYRETTAALDTTKYLVSELEYIPWQAALDNLAYFELMFDRTEVFGPMKKYMLQQVTPLYKYFENLTKNWTHPNSLMDQYNQINAVRVACGYGLQDCETMAKTFYSQWMANPNDNPIPVNLKTSIYCSAIASGNEAEWNFAWKMFQNAKIATEADKLRSAMACTKHTWLLNRYLHYTLDSTKIRKQDATSTITSIASNVIGQSLAWDFVRANWRFIFEQYGGGSFSFSSLIKGVTQRFSTEFELSQLEQFKTENEDVGFGSGTRALEQALESTKANIRWVNENKEAVHDWFLNAVNSTNPALNSLW
ncbi:alanyl (membrane) aminopeptidase b, tandem duplicate 1 [Chiloscyllium punctatum]